MSEKSEVKGMLKKVLQHTIMLGHSIMMNGIIKMARTFKYSNKNLIFSGSHVGGASNNVTVHPKLKWEVVC